MADQSNSLRVRLVTPERILIDTAASAVELPAKNGYMEVLYGHAPLLAELGAGDVRLHGGADTGSGGGEQIYNVSWGFVEVLYGHAPLLAELGAGDVRLHGGADTGSGGGDQIYNVSWGFVEVLPDRVTILANDALKPEEIDVQRAQQQLDRGQKEWNEAGDSEEKYAAALHRISEAEAKLATAQEKH